MKYIIDSGNQKQIDHALALGIDGVTANTSMYKANQTNVHDFLIENSKRNISFLSGEVMSNNLKDMIEEVKAIRCINDKAIIKINFSQEGLELCRILSSQGVPTAITLIFTIAQATAAMQAGADYLFAFIGRNDEYGTDGLNFIIDVQHMIKSKNDHTKVVAASIKNLHQLETIAIAGIDYAAIPYDLYIKSLEHPLTESGKAKFEADWKDTMEKSK